jgi:hypothetical protein
MNQKVKYQKFLKYLWLLHTPKKLTYGQLLRQGSGSGPRRPNPDPTKKVRIRPDPDPQHWIHRVVVFAVYLKKAMNSYFYIK